MLGTTQKQFEDIISGKEKLNGKTGGDAIKDALSRINIMEAIEKELEEMAKYHDIVEVLKEYF